MKHMPQHNHPMHPHPTQACCPQTQLKPYLYPCTASRIDYGPEPFAAAIGQAASHNDAFRTALWTGEHLQLTLMCIPPRGEIGMEMHPDTDQYIRVECGQAMVRMGSCPEHLDCCRRLCKDDAVFVPACTWHNIINVGCVPLKLSSVYTPPHHPRGTVHCTREDAAYSG